ncbi:ATP-dependent protease LonB [Natronorubrum daqingense]|uniref:Archaeal Lon protease n=1 Tax=Natronorubrum daqingense TaxID=588898 RepID=A0A1N6ZJF8_9EURY|nr:ATP-dependent protease LonB [Natronorubrum daqingense]APX95335.1 ATP-dependent protease LonB [Natronorubrum daqingense]SIR26894.1 Lon-like ATP-dependent protease [Natronorubrum daqingense]
MSNDTNVDDPPKDDPDAEPESDQTQSRPRDEEPASDRQGERSLLEEEGDRRDDVDDDDQRNDIDDSNGDTGELDDSDEFDDPIADPNDELESDSTTEEEDDIETVEDLGSTVEVDPGVEVDEENAEDDLLGGLKVDSTADIEVPDRLVDQVIGQDEARDIIIKAAKQRRHVMMIGSPGTGKSMLAKAMSQLLPREDLQDVLVYHNPDDGNEPKVRTVPAGKGEQIIDAHKEEARKRNQMRSILMWVIIAIIIGYTLLSPTSILLGIIAAGIVWLIFRYTSRGTDAMVPNMIVNNGDQRTAPFEDATGAHAGALLGDVRHDPFQSGGMETPSHDRVEPGSIHQSNKGVLFVDEMNTLDVRTQQKLMTAIQEGEFAITGQSERSSGAMVQTEPVPCDFIMIAAGNLDAMENMHPALRSRIKGYGYEVYMDDTIEDTAEMRRKYARFIAQEVERDGRLPHFEREAVEELILEAKRRAGRKDHLTLLFRDLGGLVRVAGDIARSEDRERTTRDDVLQAKSRSRSIEQQLADDYIERRKDYELQVTDDGVEGRVNGLAVMGEDSGIMLPVMAEIAPAQGGGQVIATGQLKEMAEESVQNVSAIIKKFSDVDLSEKDIHIQFVQAGQQGVDGDSASITVATAVISALEDIPVDQSIAMTGSLSVRGDVLPVGGVTHKIEAAAKAGCTKVIIPEANEQDVMIEEEYEEMIEIIPCSNISEVLDVALEGEPKKDSLVDRLKSITGSAFEGGQGAVGSASGSNPNPQ